ncbi:hypothetical protein DKAM_0798 [Desulfurococcus amylolyticus 1221n]|uniref:Uncharacterized protein n=1 Tax=Desulfurococcus amylolyticus (strain DSM 18924 / JCM 16383 / VKM B-2413 / 1221n) TaxID=490899 RepID=B8D4U3_DESA1|nr:hypothetical protein [Desulfurococcus amylolyticus]ACL11124.1 hypothetical protein DKAM_0798 [Desulfurococcus amylolyticus 1221n]
MPKTISVLLRRELLKHDVELLDIYRFRDREFVRVKDRVAGRVVLYAPKIRLSSVTSREDLARIVDEIASALRK